MKVLMYKNTGFNSMNIPDSPDLLPEPYIVKESVDCVQNRFLASVTVSCVNFADVRDIDYCCCIDGDDAFYYFVDSISMQAHDVCQLSLVPDFINSAGGVKNLVILDGITRRVHVASDDFGAYDEPDDYLVPSEPLQLIISDWHFDKVPEPTEPSVTPRRDTYTFLVATVDLESIGNTEGDYPATTYTDETSGDSVVVPYLIPLEDYTMFIIDDVGTMINGQKCFVAKDNIMKALSVVRSLGAENSIINQYEIPYGYCLALPDGSNGKTSIAGRDGREDCGLPINYAEVKNKRLLYGDLCKYGIVTASGNSTEFNPEEISEEGETPVIKFISDPRPDGGPYFRYAKYLGDSSTQGFFKNCVKGESWKQVPLVFTDPSNNVLNKYNFNSTREMGARERMYEKTTQGISTATNAVNAVTGIIGGVAGAATGNVSAAMSGVNQTVNSIAGIAQNVVDIQYASDKYAMKRENELMNFAFSQSVVVPTVQIPYTGGALRDFYGNGCYCYRYRPSDNDLSKFDKILTMYGYKYTKPLESTDFFNRTYFNYVDAVGISIGGNLPRWFKEGIAEQLKGVRIWHTTPNPSHYTNNPIK